MGGGGGVLGHGNSPPQEGAFTVVPTEPQACGKTATLQGRCFNDSLLLALTCVCVWGGGGGGRGALIQKTFVLLENIMQTSSLPIMGRFLIDTFTFTCFIVWPISRL